MLLCILLAFCPFGIQTPDQNSEWHFILPAPGAIDEHQPLRALSLATDRPEDVVEVATYRGTNRRYAQVRFGSASSVRVTVVLDELSPGKADFYVDADRDRRIEDSDRIDGEGPLWQVPLEVAVVDGERVQLLPRAVVFRRGSSGRTLGYAAAGYHDGLVVIDERSVAGRRFDGDGDGILTGSRDRLAFDLNSDGGFDAASEQFLYAPILRVGKVRLVTRSDEWGNRLELSPLAGMGRARVTAAALKDGATFAEIGVTLVGRDGSVVGLSGIENETEVPAGDYRIGTMTCSLDDPAGGPRWGFVFSDAGGRGDANYFEVKSDESVPIDPIGKLEFTIGLDESILPAHPGDELGVSPRLYTGHGLLIVTAYRGSPTSTATDSGPVAEIALRSAEGHTLGSTHSGFA
jgi:hypothetical protein